MLVVASYVVVGALIISLTGGCQAGQVEPEKIGYSQEAVVGKEAPEFELTDSNGKKKSLHDYKSKFVVLEWVNYECPFVKKHYSGLNMQKLQNTYTKQGVVWLSINSSANGKQGNYLPSEVNKLMAEKRACPTAYLFDTDGKVGRLYGAKTTPHMFVINPNGTLIYAGAIDDKAGVDPNETPQAKNYVQLALDEAMGGKAVSVPKTKSYGCSVKYQ